MITTFMGELVAWWCEYHQAHQPAQPAEVVKATAEAAITHMWSRT